MLADATGAATNDEASRATVAKTVREVFLAMLEALSINGGEKTF